MELDINCQEDPVSYYLRVLYNVAYNDNTIIRERLLASP
jgi:hypothetical protein